MERRELHTGGLDGPSFIRGVDVGAWRETSAHEALAEGALIAEYCNFAPVTMAALTARAVNSGLDSVLGLPTSVEYETSENATDSCERCFPRALGVSGGDFGACVGDAAARLGELGARVGDLERR